MDADPAVPPVQGGPWGGFMDVVICLLPILVLLFTTLKPRPMPTTRSLPLCALLLYALRLAYFGADPAEVTAQALAGTLSALTPISIVAGAIFLFECMQSANITLWLRVQMSALTAGHAVAEVMLVGWAFAYLIEGASGFGTPAALATPILLSLGHPKLQCVCCLLLLNSFATVFGAVGTPIWFGLAGALGGDEAALLRAGLYAAVGTGAAAVLLVPLVVRLLVPWRQVAASLLFIELSVLSCAGSAIAVSTFSYEFPALLGGLAGLLATALLVRFKVGLAQPEGGGRAVAPAASRGARDEEGGGGRAALALRHQDSASPAHALQPGEARGEAAPAAGRS